MGVVESLVTGRDGIVRGANVRVVTKGKSVHLSRPVKNALSVRDSERSGMERGQVTFEIGLSKIPQEMFS